MTNYEIKTDHDGQPMLCRKIQGRNADSMTGSEVIARGDSEILSLTNIMSGYWDDERKRREQASGASVKQPLTPHWTNETPTAPGWYWWRADEQAESKMMGLVMFNQLLASEGNCFGWKVVENMQGQWQGPIAPAD